MTRVMGGKASQTYDMLHLMSTSGAYYNWNSACMHYNLSKNEYLSLCSKIKSRCFQKIADFNASLNMSLVKVFKYWNILIKRITHNTWNIQSWY